MLTLGGVSSFAFFIIIHEHSIKSRLVYLYLHDFALLCVVFSCGGGVCVADTDSKIMLDGIQCLCTL